MWSHSKNYCREILCVFFIERIIAEEHNEPLRVLNMLIYWVNNAVWETGTGRGEFGERGEKIKNPERQRHLF